LTAHDRVVALSEQLTQVHQAMRERLASLRQSVAGGGNPVPWSLDEHLRAHCLGFCAAIHSHHTGEDNQLLPMLRAAEPGLAPVIDNLVEDHALVAGILRRVHGLVDAEGSRPDKDILIRELDGLTAILDSHFGYEERRIAQALDRLGPRARTPDVFEPFGSGS
jgi:hypothetical protein